MADCILCKIVGGDVPSHKVYEDEDTVAVMDIHPIQPGQVLVFPKKHTKTFEQQEEGEFASLMRIVHKIANKMKTALSPSRIGVVIEGFDVPHAHVKVLPIENEVELRRIPNITDEPDHKALTSMAEKLAILPS